MTIPKSVLGVLSVCWVDSGSSTQIAIPESVSLRAVCRVCWVYARAGARARDIHSDLKGGNFFHANPEKPNKPNTLNTCFLNCLISMGFICVGFVLGCLRSVLGLFCGGIWG